MTIQELKTEAKRLKQEGNFLESANLYEKLWELEKNEWNGYFLAQSYRKTENYIKARELHNQLEILYPNFKPLQNEKLWLDYSEKIKDWQNPDLIADAENLIARADKYDKYTGSVYTKTVLNVVKHLIYLDDFSGAKEWLLKLDQSVISNEGFIYNGQWYPADRKIYFINYADVVIRLDSYKSYVENSFEKLNFKSTKNREFSSYLYESITFDDNISRRRLAKHIKHFEEEFAIRKKQNIRKIYNPNKSNLVSDLSHYLFCPVSFAINETFEVEVNNTWEKDEWLGHRKTLIDRYNNFKKTKNYTEAYKDSEIQINDTLKNDFAFIFNSKIIIDNVSNNEKKIYSNNDKTLFGIPDYVMESENGKRYAITEKFSSIYSADSKTPFDSDLIKHFAFLEEFQEARLDFGLFITWYWNLIDIETNNGRIKKKMVITSYRITKIERDQQTKIKLNNAIKRVSDFKKNKSMEIDADKISYANKCFNCSVFIYCNHKTGKFDNITLPYNLTQNKLNENIITKSEPMIRNIENEEDDLPF